MAGDWVKMTHELPDKPEVIAISAKAGITRYETVGRLFVLWRWFDNQTLDGNATGVTSVTLNETLFGYGDATRFVSAVVEVGWLVENEAGILVKNFDYHISESAKTRAQTAKRVGKHRTSKSNAKTVTKSVPREEKRREEVNNPPIPPADISVPDGLDMAAWERWLDYRTKIRKPIKPVSVSSAQRELAGFGEDQAAVVEQSIAHGWQGLFAKRGDASSVKANGEMPRWKQLGYPRESDYQHSVREGLVS